VLAVELEVEDELREVDEEEDDVDALLMEVDVVDDNVEVVVVVVVVVEVEEVVELVGRFPVFMTETVPEPKFAMYSLALAGS
jgi:hypothetical protein